MYKETCLEGKMNEKLLTQAHNMHFIQHLPKEEDKKTETKNPPHHTLTEHTQHKHTQPLWDWYIFVLDICQNTSIPSKVPSKTHSFW